MSQWPPHGGGYGPPPNTNPYMSGPPAQASMGAMPSNPAPQQMAELISLVKTGYQFPAQWKAGIIQWPNRWAFPMVLTEELLVFNGTSYGTTNDVARASFQIDVSNPTYVTHISFNLFQPDVNGNTGRIGMWLPLGATRDPFPAAANPYIGRDFRWRVFTSSNDIMWQTGWRTSDQCNGDGREGYKLPIEFQLRRNDTLNVEVQPIGPVPDPARTYTLEVALHCYKMLQVE